MSLTVCRTTTGTGARGRRRGGVPAGGLRCRRPAAFDPERFAPERREDRSHRFAWEPFGGGVHKCIGLHFAGLEVKAIMHRLLRGYRWSVDPGYVAPLDHHALPFPRDGQPIALSRT